MTKVYRTYERVPNETLTSSHGLNNRDYDYPEDYIADYESQLYAKPYRKYGSPQRFDYVNGMAHGNGSSGDVFDRSDLYGSNHSTKSKRHPSSIPHDDGWFECDRSGSEKHSSGLIAVFLPFAQLYVL